MTTRAPARRRLQFLEPTARQPKANVLLYGPPKRGKTTGAATAPGPILWLNAEGPDALDFARSQHPGKIREYPVRGWQDLSDAWQYLKDGGDGEKTVVVDTVPELWRVLVEEKAPGQNRPSIQQFGDVGTTIERLARFLCRDCPQNVVLICHEQYMDSPDGRMLMPQTGGQKNPMILCSMVTVVGYVEVVEERDKPPRYIARVQPAPGRYAGHRNGILGQAADLNLTDWVRRYAEIQAPKKETS